MLLQHRNVDGRGLGAKLLEAEMEILGFIILVVIIAVAVAVLAGFGVIRFPSRRGGGGGGRANDAVEFSLEPQVICADANCDVKVHAKATTSQSAAAGHIKVLKSNGRREDFAQGLVIDKVLSGLDPFFASGTGQYVFTFEATGLAQGTVRQTKDLFVVDANFRLPHVVTRNFAANDSAQTRRLASNIFVLGQVQGFKSDRVLTMCKEISVKEIVYTSGGFAGFPDSLTVEVYDASGRLIVNAALAPGQALAVPRGAVQQGGVIVTSMPSGNGAPFPIGSTVPWTIQVGLSC